MAMTRDSTSNLVMVVKALFVTFKVASCFELAPSFLIVLNFSYAFLVVALMRCFIATSKIGMPTNVA